MSAEAVEAISAAPAVEVRGVGRTFPGRPPVVALDHVDLVVPTGSLTAVLGPSGSGKTTLLRIIAGIERPDAGRVRIGADDVDGPGGHVGPERRSVGLVPQEGALFPHLDVAGNIGFGLARASRPERARRVAELLDLVGLAGMQRRRPHELSGGQQQRVALARALAPAPEVVLLDEPFSALDASLRTELRDEVADLLGRAGATAILVTHDQQEALAMADRVAVMHHGRVIQHGAPADVYHRPCDLWVAGFVGDAVTMPGELVGGERALVRCGLGTLAADLPPVDAPEPGPVTVFLRPEQVTPVDDGLGVAATVERVRFLGPDVVADLVVAGSSLTARWPSSVATPSAGETTAVRVTGRVIAFAPEHG